MREVKWCKKKNVTVTKILGPVVCSCICRVRFGESKRANILRHKGRFTRVMGLLMFPSIFRNSLCLLVFQIPLCFFILPLFFD